MIRERETMRARERDADGTREENRGEEVAPRGLEVQRSCQAARPGTNRELAAIGRECALRGRDANIEDR